MSLLLLLFLMVMVEVKDAVRSSTDDIHDNDDTEVRFQRPPDWYDKDIHTVRCIMSMDLL